eukprot:jgi/Mesen1/2323/ME000155S01413
MHSHPAASMTLSPARLPSAFFPLLAAVLSLPLLLARAGDPSQFYKHGEAGILQCPILLPTWGKPEGVIGGIVDTSTRTMGPEWTASSPSELYHYDVGQPSGCPGVPNPPECSQLCRQWPLSFDGKATMNAINGVGGPCAYWSWDGINGCYLFSCDVCKDSSSFDPAMKRDLWHFPFQSGGSDVDCWRGGRVVGDPHFTGADGSHFDYTGHPGQVYCLVSDAHVHVNAYYGGRYGTWGENTNKSMTWIRKVAILWGRHSVVLEAREGATWQYGAGYLASAEVDGEQVVGQMQREGDVARFFGGQLSLTWAHAKLPSGDDLVDVYEVVVENVVTARLTLRPEVALLRTGTDGVVHFGVSFPRINLTNSAHGVLGQTHRADHRGRLSEQELVMDEHLGVRVVPGENAEGFLDADVEAYRSSSLLEADCSFSRFVRASVLDEESSRAVELAKTPWFRGSAAAAASASRKMMRRK